MIWMKVIVENVKCDQTESKKKVKKLCDDVNEINRYFSV